MTIKYINYTQKRRKDDDDDVKDGIGGCYYVYVCVRRLYPCFWKHVRERSQNCFAFILLLCYQSILLPLLIANMLLPSMIAHFAFDITAPNETAFTFLFNIPYSRLMTPAAAHYFTAIDSRRCSIAETTFCSHNAQPIWICVVHIAHANA